MTWESRQSLPGSRCAVQIRGRLSMRLVANLTFLHCHTLGGDLIRPMHLGLRAIRDIAARHEIDLWQAEWTPYAESLQDAWAASDG